MQRFLGELHSRSLSFVTAHVSKIDVDLVPATHVRNSPRVAPAAVLYHCRLPFCHMFPGEGFVLYV
jgi:hypothetical protein